MKNASFENLNLTFEIENSSKAKLTFNLEPWGDFCEMKPSEIFRIKFKRPIKYNDENQNPHFSVSLEDGNFTLWGGVDSTVEIFSGEKRVLAGINPVPRIE